eukprot:m.139298 g.139298  ORF g.139298 m.139298 type:complete len:82 (+) comp14795_c0_seq2:71-316(+)
MNQFCVYIRGQTIMTLDIISHSPLMFAGTLPADETTLAYLTNKVALDVHTYGKNIQVVDYQGNCSCHGGAFKDVWSQYTLN